MEAEAAPWAGGIDAAGVQAFVLGSSSEGYGVTIGTWRCVAGNTTLVAALRRHRVYPLDRRLSRQVALSELSDHIRFREPRPSGLANERHLARELQRIDPARWEAPG